MLEGRYFPPRSARIVPARALAANGRLRIEDTSGALLAEAEPRRVRVSPRLGHLARGFDLADGSRFETDDNDGADALVRALRLKGAGRTLDRIERSWRFVAASVVVAVALSIGYVEFGIPWLAGRLAAATPDSVARLISRQTLDLIDGSMLGASKLAPSDRAHAETVFARVARAAPRGAGGYRLALRDGRGIGANAFALPDGTVVLTDQLWKLKADDNEIAGVFAHEMAHVDRRHGLQSVYQASMIPAAIALISGDVSQMGHLATILPGVLVQSAYARGFEQQADDDAAALMIRMGMKPSELANLLDRMEAKHCGKPGCPRDWIGDHPDTQLRSQKLRAETK
jgi:Zn-dependent protease with chaperone function